MAKDIEWPTLPTGESNAELELFKAKLEVIKAEQQAWIDRITEQKKAEIALELADHQAQIVQEAANHTAKLAKDAAIHAAEIEEVKAAASANFARETADYANEYTTLQEIYKGYIEVIKGEIDRSFQRADFVQKVAATIGAAHAAIMALTFSAADNALPLSGLAPAIFLSLSFFLATAYVAYFSRPNDIQTAPSDGSLRGNQDSRLDTFIKWAKESVLRRKYLLQCAVVSLAVSVFFLPAPYLTKLGQTTLWILVVVGILLVFGIPWLISRTLETEPRTKKVANATQRDL